MFDFFRKKTSADKTIPAERYELTGILYVLHNEMDKAKCLFNGDALIILSNTEYRNMYDILRQANPFLETHFVSDAEIKIKLIYDIDHDKFYNEYIDIITNLRHSILMGYGFYRTISRMMECKKIAEQQLNKLTIFKNNLIINDNTYIMDKFNLINLNFYNFWSVVYAQNNIAIQKFHDIKERYIDATSKIEIIKK